MKAHHIMTRKVITIAQDANVADAARLMLDHHISGLPVVDKHGALVGILTERDFLRRQEIDTQTRRPRWLQFVLGPDRMAEDFVKTSGRKVYEIMTRDPYTATEDAPLTDLISLMEKHHIKRIPIVRDSALVGIVSRRDFMQAVCSLSRDVPNPSEDDSRLRERILAAIDVQHWAPGGLNAIVKNGVVDLSGVITDEYVRQAIIVATENIPGVKEVHDHIAWVDPMSGIYLLSPEEEAESAARRAKAS